MPRFHPTDQWLLWCSWSLDGRRNIHPADHSLAPAPAPAAHHFPKIIFLVFILRRRGKFPQKLGNRNTFIYWNEIGDGHFDSRTLAHKYHLLLNYKGRPLKAAYHRIAIVLLQIWSAKLKYLRCFEGWHSGWCWSVRGMNTRRRYLDIFAVTSHSALHRMSTWNVYSTSKYQYQYSHSR